MSLGVVKRNKGCVSDHLINLRPPILPFISVFEHECRFMMLASFIMVKSFLDFIN